MAVLQVSSTVEEIGGGGARRRADRWAVVESGAEWSVREEERKWETSPLCWATCERVRTTPRGAVATDSIQSPSCHRVQCRVRASDRCGRLSGVGD
jgi:hypothetical protein